MRQERLLKILLAPHVSEKTTRIGEKHRQVVFHVVNDANKHEIKLAVEKLFNVSVDSVRTCIVKAKAKRFRGMMGTRKSWKKAYITLSEGSDIQFASA